MSQDTTSSPVHFEGSQKPNGEEFEPRIVARYGRFRVVEQYDEEDGGSIRSLEERTSDAMGADCWNVVRCGRDTMYPLLEALRALCRHGVVEDEKGGAR